MTRSALVLVMALVLAACSTRSVVVAPEEVSKLNAGQWTITSPPAAAR